MDGVLALPPVSGNPKAKGVDADEQVLGSISQAIDGKQYCGAIKLCLPLAESPNNKKAHELFLRILALGNDCEDVFAHCADNQKTSVAAAIALGLLCLSSSKNRRDYPRAKELFEREDVKDHPMAQHGLGIMYFNGGGVKQDYEKAARYHLKLATDGYSRSQYAIGYMYLKGLGVGKDYLSANHFLNLSANQGNQSAQYYLGGVHYEGLGVDKNFNEAAKYFELSAKQGESVAQFFLGEMYRTGEIGKKADGNNNYDKAVHYYELSARQGDPRAQYALGLMYDQGQGVGKNHETAFRYYTDAALQRDVLALKTLGKMYFHGTGHGMKHADFYMARVCFELASLQVNGKSKTATYYLSLLQKNRCGILVPENNKIEELYIEAARNMKIPEGDIYLQLGVSYAKGHLSKRISHTQAIRCFETAHCQHKHPSAATLLAKTYESMNLLDRVWLDKDYADHWYQVAIKQQAQKQ